MSWLKNIEVSSLIEPCKIVKKKKKNVIATSNCSCFTQTQGELAELRAPGPGIEPAAFSKPLSVSVFSSKELTGSKCEGRRSEMIIIIIPKMRVCTHWVQTFYRNRLLCFGKGSRSGSSDPTAHHCSDSDMSRFSGAGPWLCCARFFFSRLNSTCVFFFPPDRQA